jgi:hypothetical protein
MLLGGIGLVAFLLFVPLVGGFVPGSGAQSMVLGAGTLAGWLLRRADYVGKEKDGIARRVHL